MQSKYRAVIALGILIAVGGCSTPTAPVSPEPTVPASGILIDSEGNKVIV